MSIANLLRPLAGSPSDYDPILDAARDGRFVLLGEASHGTQEFYFERAMITRRLVEEHGFEAVAVEGDWPDAYRVNRFVQGAGDDTTPDGALSGFRRFPSWMWRNEVVRELVAWLRERNRRARVKAGFYGMDLYSMFTSMEAVLGYLARTDPEAARRARARYACFDHFHEDSQAYGYAASLGITKACEDEAVRQLLDLRLASERYLTRDGQRASEAFFEAEQNARLVRNAEEYYRSMFAGRVSSWNLRDRHMAETLEALAAHLQRRGGSGRVVVWAHNSHLGDARATEMGRMGELNVGQLMRERHGAASVSVGFTTYTGTVTAASDWDGPVETKDVRPGMDGSYEELFHGFGEERFLLWLRGASLPPELRGDRLERAIGVIYRPETERASHYFDAMIAAQFDAVIHIDRTRALRPLELASSASDEPPETFPSGK